MRAKYDDLLFLQGLVEENEGQEDENDIIGNNTVTVQNAWPLYKKIIDEPKGSHRKNAIKNDSFYLWRTDQPMIKRDIKKQLDGQENIIDP
jgi:hypothetical protein